MNPRVALLLLAGVVVGAGLAALLALSPLGRDWLAKPDAAAAEPAAKAPEAEQFYTCGMHPEVVQREPGRCPICGMKLVPKKPAARDPAAASGSVQVAPDFLQNFAVRTAAVTRGALPISISTVGELAHNEEKLVAVNTKFEGWIEKAYVNNIGERVEQGDPLFDIYSPSLATTQREYLAAADYVDKLVARDAYPDSVARARSLLEAARERLRYWDVTEAQIAALESTREAPRTVRFFAPATGFVVAKTGDSLEGMRLEPGMTVLKIADHSTLWAQAEFYEEDLPHVREGSEAVIEVAAFPDRRWRGTILFFRAAVDPETRALTAFVEVDNADLALRPMMYVDVSIRADGAADAVLAPEESVLHSGERTVVIVAKEDGVFEPREVTVGLAAQGMQEIVSGLAPGERVVVASQFLIDSESNLKAAISRLLRSDAGESDAPDEQDDQPQHHHHHH